MKKNKNIDEIKTQVNVETITIYKGDKEIMLGNTVLNLMFELTYKQQLELDKLIIRYCIDKRHKR